MALKESKVKALLEGLVDLMQAELDLAKGQDGIPLSASDKAVCLALIKHCNVTAEPDSDDMKNLERSFSAAIEEKREGRAKALLAQTKDDGLDSLMH